MLALRQTLRCTRPVAVALLLTVAAACGPAAAQGRLEARYTVSLAGIAIGKGSWLVDITDSQYSASATGTTTGLLRAFTTGQGTTAARGTLQAGRPVTSLYASYIKTSKKTDDVRLTINNGNVKDARIDPPVDQSPDRLPITDAHRRDIFDPMTASLMRVEGAGDPLVPEACRQNLAIFDGRLRYNLQLAYKRMDKVKADTGYAGPVVVCAVQFLPVAGFNPSRFAIKYIAKLRDIEVWLAPIAGTRVLVPFRAQGPSPVGNVVLEADQFVSMPLPSRASATGTKTQ